MPTIQDIDPRFRHVNRKVFLFVVSALTVVVVALYFLATEKDIFAPRYELRFMTETAFGFSEGMAVKLAGFRIGKIKSVTMDENARVVVHLELKKAYQKWIRSDSAATLNKEGYIGESIIEISFGDRNKSELADGDEIRFSKGRGLQEIAQELVEDMKPVALDVKHFVERITSPQGDVSRTLKNTADLTGDLRETNRQVQQMIADLKPVLADVRDTTKPLPEKVKKTLDNVEDVTRKMQTVADNVTATTKALKDELPPILSSTQATMKNVERLSGELAKQSNSVKPIVENVEDIADNGRDISGAVKRTWPISSKLPPPQEPAVIAPRTIREPAKDGTR